MARPCPGLRVAITRLSLRRRIQACAVGLLMAACRHPSEMEAPAQATSDLSLAIFAEEAAARGMDFEHANGMNGNYLFVEMMGAGVAVLDIDRDDDLNVFLPQGHPLGAGGRPSAAARPWATWTTTATATWWSVTTTARRASLST